MSSGGRIVEESWFTGSALRDLLNSGVGCVSMFVWSKPRYSLQVRLTGFANTVQRGKLKAHHIPVAVLICSAGMRVPLRTTVIGSVHCTRPVSVTHHDRDTGSRTCHPAHRHVSTHWHRPGSKSMLCSVTESIHGPRDRLIHWPSH